METNSKGGDRDEVIWMYRRDEEAQEVEALKMNTSDEADEEGKNSDVKVSCS